MAVVIGLAAIAIFMAGRSTRGTKYEIVNETRYEIHMDIDTKKNVITIKDVGRRVNSKDIDGDLY